MTSTAVNLNKFSPWNPHNEHRAYYMAHNVIYDMADSYFTKIEKPIVRLKGQYRDASKAEKESVPGRHPWFDNPQYYFPVFFTRGTSNNVLNAKCEHWFHDNCQRMIEGMFHCNGWNDIGQAIKGTHSYEGLCNRWDDWFEERKDHWMKDYSELILKQKGVPAKMPSAHGGVANLLKVLTKTMMNQGSDIRTIAKVQYAVCSQAGIYIPSEFLTDVAVALDYNDKMEVEP